MRHVVFHGELVRYSVEVPGGAWIKVTQPYRGRETIFASGQSAAVWSSPQDWRVFE